MLANSAVLIPEWWEGMFVPAGGIIGVRRTSNRTLDRIRHPNIIGRDLITHIWTVLTGLVFSTSVWESVLGGALPAGCWRRPPFRPLTPALSLTSDGGRTTERPQPEDQTLSQFSIHHQKPTQTSFSEIRVAKVTNGCGEGRNSCAAITLIPSDSGADLAG